MLNAALNVPQLSECFRQNGRIQINDILAIDVARTLQKCLLHDLKWDLAYRENGTSCSLPSEVWQQQTPAQQQDLAQRIIQSAKSEFQFCYFRYGMISAYKEGRDSHLPLRSFVEFLNSESFLAFARALTGFDDIRKVDAQATCYQPGQFLTRHDDTGKEDGSVRRAAYVLSLSTEWLAEWGGLLHFIEDNGEVSDTFLPKFNTLNVFRTPQMHSVSYVAPYARTQRISITGWMRAD